MRVTLEGSAETRGGAGVEASSSERGPWVRGEVQGVRWFRVHCKEMRLENRWVQRVKGLLTK